MGDGAGLHVCGVLANNIAEVYETMAALVRRAVDLRRQLEPLEGEGNPDLVAMERVRQELVDVNSQLAVARQALATLERDYNVAGCPTLG
jgi:hypothetical protein